MERFLHLFDSYYWYGEKRSFGLTFSWKIVEETENEIKVRCAVARCHNEKNFSKKAGRILSKGRLLRARERVDENKKEMSFCIYVRTPGEIKEAMLMHYFDANRESTRFKGLYLDWMEKTLLKRELDQSRLDGESDAEY